MRLKLALDDGDRKDRFVEISKDKCPLLDKFNNNYMKILLTYFRQVLRIADIKIESGIVEEKDLLDVAMTHGLITGQINKHYKEVQTHTREVFCIQYSDLESIRDFILFSMWKLLKSKHELVILSVDKYIAEASEELVKLMETYMDAGINNLYDIQEGAERFIEFTKSLKDFYELLSVSLENVLNTYPEWYEIEDIYFVFNY